MATAEQAAPKAAPKAAAKPATAPRGRKPVKDKDAPHGRDESGQPLAPHGLTSAGVPRLTPSRDASDLDLGALSNPQPVTDELAEAARPQRVRSAQQQTIDNVVARLHQAWVQAGKPRDWVGEKSIPKARYAMDPKKADTLRFLIRKAADFHKVRIRWGSAVRDGHGNEVVVFGVVDKSAREK